MIQLLQGDFKEGWIGYESRWKARSIPMPARYAQLGMWDGGDVAGEENSIGFASRDLATRFNSPGISL